MDPALFFFILSLKSHTWIQHFSSLFFLSCNMYMYMYMYMYMHMCMHMSM